MCVSELTFTAPAPFYAARAAEVTIVGLDNLPPFYINTRNQSGGVVTVSCLDRLAFSDIMFPHERLTDKGNIPISSVMELLSMALGRSVPKYGGIPSWLTSIPYERLEDTPCTDILQLISETCCGVWRYASDNSPQFLKFGDNSGLINIRKHTALDIGADYVMSNVICTDSSGRKYSRGTADHIYDTVRINSELITDEGCGEIWERAKGVTVTAWKCDKCLLDGNIIPDIGCRFRFEGGGEYAADSIDCSVTATGIYMTLSGGQTSDEISTRGSLTRAIDSFQTRKSGNIRYTRYQDIIIEDDKEK